MNIYIHICILIYIDIYICYTFLCVCIYIYPVMQVTHIFSKNLGREYTLTGVTVDLKRGFLFSFIYIFFQMCNEDFVVDKLPFNNKI